MTALDWFIYLVGGSGILLLSLGFGILNNRRLEMGALVGVYPLMWGMGFTALAALLFALTHVSIRIV